LPTFKSKFYPEASAATSAGYFNGIFVFCIKAGMFVTATEHIPFYAPSWIIEFFAAPQASAICRLSFPQLPVAPFLVDVCSRLALVPGNISLVLTFNRAELPSMGLWSSELFQTNWTSFGCPS
jgi:hypothetical protein